MQAHRSIERALTSAALLARTLRLLWHASPACTSGWAALCVVQGLLPAVSVFLTGAFVDSLTNHRSLRSTLLLGAGIAAALFAAQVLRALGAWLRTVQSELVADHISAIVHRQSCALDLAFYESAEFHDRLHRARDEAAHRPIALLESAGLIAENSISLGAMAVILARFGIWVPAALVLATAPALLVVFKHRIAQHAWRQRSAPLERRAWYYDWLLTGFECAAELRLFYLGPRFASAYQRVRARLRSERIALSTRQAIAEGLAGLFALAVAGAAMLWMISRASAGQIGLGALAMFYQAFHNGSSLARNLLENVGQLYANSLFLGNLFEFLELRPALVSPTRPAVFPSHLRQSIRLRDVTFGYPGRTRPALDRLSLEIPAGRITAVVGANGAGKSTLLKLLCRLYDPDQGAVEIDGTDLRAFALDEVRNHVTVLFQEPVRYNASAAENIAFGSLDGEPSREAVELAAWQAGVDDLIGRLPGGYGALLGKWYEDGVDLSAGEWQKIALARAFLRNSPLIVLDEPTSAMDPWAEAEWLERFRRLAAGRTAVVITHRFTTARMADRICVMDEGRVVEQGTHDELLDRDGLYARGWDAQQRPEGAAV